MKHSKKIHKCPRCSSKDVMFENSYDDRVDLYICAECDYVFKVSNTKSVKLEEDIYEVYDDSFNDQSYDEFADEDY